MNKETVPPRQINKKFTTNITACGVGDIEQEIDKSVPEIAHILWAWNNSFRISLILNTLALRAVLSTK